MATPDQINALGKEFIDSHYDYLLGAKSQQIDSLNKLSARYNDSSTFSWESDTVIGTNDILAKISALQDMGTFEKSSFSAQLRDTILIVLATGILTPKGADEGRGMNYTECFVINVSRNDSGFQFQILNQVGKMAL